MNATPPPSPIQTQCKQIELHQGAGEKTKKRYSAEDT